MINQHILNKFEQFQKMLENIDERCEKTSTLLQFLKSNNNQMTEKEIIEHLHLQYQRQMILAQKQIAETERRVARLENQKKLAAMSFEEFVKIYGQRFIETETK